MIHKSSFYIKQNIIRVLHRCLVNSSPFFEIGVAIIIIATTIIAAIISPPRS